jgi:SpoIID/LytB domain protein
LVLPAAAVAAEPERRRFGAVIAPVRLVPHSPDPLSVPDLHDFFGTIRLESRANGLVLINQLRLERYLLGLNEVPTDWHMEALKAQAVAARTYALHQLAQPRAGEAELYGFDICASVECQVFSGADVVGTLQGGRWQDAVERTQGEVVLYDAQPILARYHSTSGGRTLENSEVFTDEPSYPYLKSVPSPSEKNAPLYRWTVRFRRSELQAILERAGWWTRRNGRLESVSTRPSAAGWYFPDVVMRGSSRHLIRTAKEFREMLAVRAPEMFPNKYPSRAKTSSGFLPETLPSNRFRIVSRDGIVAVHGRGWGHGVGMSQWGAQGMANDGATYEEILEHYYTGVTVERAAAPGATIDVGVGWAMPSVAVHGHFKIVNGTGRTVVEEALGTWIFHSAGPGAISVDPPQGRGVRLEVGIVESPPEVGAGEAAELVVALTKPAHVWTVTQGSDDREDRQVRNAGRQPVTWRAPREPGDYEVRVEASSGTRRRLSEPVEIVVRPRAQADRGERRDGPGDRAEAGTEAEDGLPWVVMLVLLVTILGILIVVSIIRRYGDERAEPSLSDDRRPR